MIDGIIKADGTSRLMRAELPATYEEFRAQCRDGTQPLDILFNALGWSQLPTFLNKENLLKDPTASMFGLGADAVPNDVFGVLSRFQNGLGNEYVWAKCGYVDYFNPGSFVYDSISVSGIDSGGDTIVYSDTSDMQNPKTVSIAYDKYQDANVLAGKFFHSQGNSSAIYYGEPNTKAGRSIANNIYRVEFSFSKSWSEGTRFETIGYVNSPDPNAYPVDDGYTYKALGRLGAKVQIATGSYTGTGTYGADNPNSLTFDFEPKLVVIAGGGAAKMVAVNGETTCLSYAPGGSSGNNFVTVTWNGNAVSWCFPGSGNAAYQLNTAGTTYHYVAIG